MVTLTVKIAESKLALFCKNNGNYSGIVSSTPLSTARIPLKVTLFFYKLLKSI